jgi:hypothetical protein
VSCRGGDSCPPVIVLACVGFWAPSAASIDRSRTGESPEMCSRGSRDSEALRRTVPSAVERFLPRMSLSSRDTVMCGTPAELVGPRMISFHSRLSTSGKKTSLSEYGSRSFSSLVTSSSTSEDMNSSQALAIAASSANSLVSWRVT